MSIYPFLWLLFALANLCLMSGPIGWRALQVTGLGRQKGLGATGTVITLVGQASYMVGMVYIVAFPDYEFQQPFTPIGAFGSSIGMILVGIATLKAGAIHGWRAWLPLMIGLYFFIQLPVQAIFRFSQGLPPAYPVLGLWGLGWIILGYVIASSQNDR
jgi:hypothetical protein